MNLILDTHILLWVAGGPEQLAPEAVSLIEDPQHSLYFSAASIWKIVIKNGLDRDDFQVDPHLLRRGLIENGYRELPISAQHALGVSHLPPIHKDPVDRILVAQAQFEGFLLITSDEWVAQYPGPIRRI